MLRLRMYSFCFKIHFQLYKNDEIDLKYLRYIYKIYKINVSIQIKGTLTSMWNQFIELNMNYRRKIVYEVNRYIFTDI